MKYMVRKALLFPLLALGFLQAGCQDAGSSGNSQLGLVQSGLVSANDVRYMHGLAAARGGSVRMDLSDPTQYRFLTARLTASGKTPQNSPQFFKMIEGIKQRHTAKKQDPDFQAQMTDKPRDHILGNVVRVDGTNTFRVTTFATIQDGADYNFVDGVAYTESGQQLSDYGWGEEYGDGRKLVAQPVGPINTTTAMPIKVDSLNLVSINGIEESFYFMEDTLVPAQGPGGVLEHPRDANGDGIVTICLDRNYGDCDYPLVGEWIVRFPAKGHIIFANEVLSFDPPLQPPSFMKLTDLNGGPKNMAFGPLINWLRIDQTDKRKVTWDIPQAYGQFNGVLFQRYEDVDFFLSVSVKMKRCPTCPATQTVNATAKISSIDRAAEASTNGMPKAKDMQMVYSCLAKGTQVQLADGKTAKVEDVARGAMVKSTASGVALPVADISVGIERIPMVHITDSAGRDLLMTSSHPVMTPDQGVVWAEELKVGSQVLTNTGVSTLVKVSQEMYSDNVYNLKLDRSQLKDDAKGSTMYANGFLVGDLAMQKAYEFKNTQNLRADVLSRLPARWHADYLRSTKVASR
jgi:Hint-domain